MVNRSRSFRDESDSSPTHADAARAGLPRLRLPSSSFDLTQLRGGGTFGLNSRSMPSNAAPRSHGPSLVTSAMTSGLL